MTKAGTEAWEQAYRTATYGIRLSHHAGWLQGHAYQMRVPLDEEQQVVPALLVGEDKQLLKGLRPEWVGGRGTLWGMEENTNDDRLSFLFKECTLRSDTTTA